MIGGLGVVGVFCRYGVGLLTQSWSLANGFPVGTFLVNLLGALLAGAIYAYSSSIPSFSPELRLGLTVGFLGGFTTFSAYCGETLQLLEKGSITLALTYWGLSPVLGLLFAVLGAWVTRRVIG